MSSTHTSSPPTAASSPSATSAPRILFLNHSATLGGGELSLLDIATDWNDTGHMLLFEDGPLVGRLAERGIPHTVLSASTNALAVSRDAGPTALLRAVPAVLDLARQIRRHAQTADLLYANSQKAMILAALVGAWTRTPVVWHLRDMMTADHFSRSNRRLVTALANRLLTRVLCNSDATRAAFVQAGGRANLCTVIPNGIDPAPFDAVARSPADIRRDAGLPPDVPMVGIFSRLADWKGQHVLVEALRTLPGVHAAIVGDAMFAGDRPYTERLRRQIHDAGLQDRVHLLGFQDEVAPLMTAVDVVAHCSTAPEPFGRVIVEAQMARRPVVATRAGGAAEIIDDGVNGLLVAPGDPPSLRAALARLVEAPAFAAQLADAGHAHAHAEYSLSTLLRRIRAAVRPFSPSGRRPSASSRS